ncbi:MAG TPA: FxSxx-COOH system tetratricopeptide repeat protein, partial [Ktedonobacteraceae bacterium]|nr:FxSxx-COOH system tetratricopeptide repeat protein [Ktedonobacteraceae bacterium]
FNHEYFAVFWLNAQTAESLLASVIALASLLNLPEWQEQEQQRIVTAVVHWLNRHDQWLLIFDNVDDVALVKAFLPAAHHGSLLFTSRRQSLGFTSQVLDLGYMSLEDGVQFLLHRAGFLTQASAHALAPSEQSAAQEIVAAMGGLPLALDQAGSYIEASRCGFSEYLHLYQVAQFRLLDEREAHADHAESVARTFALIFTRLKQQDLHARELLIACAFLAPEAIPEAFFREGASVLGSLLQTLTADPFAFYAAVKTLRMFSLLQRDVSTQTLMMHRLVQVVLKEELSPEERQGWTRRVMQALCQAFPLSESTQTDYWRGCEQLLPHAMYLLQSHGQVEAELALECTALMNRVALYLIERAAYPEAESLLHKAWEMGRCILGEEHSHIADTLFAQGNLLLRQGKYEQAETLSVRALQMRERELGPDHLQVALSLYGLGLLYARQSRYAEAERLYQRALTIREQTLGSDHPQVATTLTALAITYAEQGCYAEAEQLNLRALTIREQTLGSDHPQVATLLNNMAHDYTEQSRYTEAEPLFQRALQIWQQHLGPEHPRVAYPLNNLAELYQAQGRYEEAEPLFRQALRIWEQKLGTEHFLVADPVSGLAHIARAQGKLEDAEALYRRSLQIREKALGPQHPYVALSLTGLAQLAQLQKNYHEAISFYQQVLQIKERTL